VHDRIRTTRSPRDSRSRGLLPVGRAADDLLGQFDLFRPAPGAKWITSEQA
jgi:hypothetical protein